jgi:hypothetical protein
MKESMTTNEQFSRLLTATFPSQPMPANFFWKEGVHDADDEFSRDLLEWLARRQWTEIKMSDWTMIGHISVVRERLEPLPLLLAVIVARRDSRTGVSGLGARSHYPLGQRSNAEE